MHNDTHKRKDSAHDFIVKFSTSVCVAVVAFLTGELAAGSFAYHAHGTAHSDNSCCMLSMICACAMTKH